MIKKQTILIVDDSPAIIEQFTDLLDDRYQTKVATNGTKTLKLAAANPPPDLILLDIMMPEMDGFDVCDSLKADKRTRDIPVVFVTAKTDKEDIAKGLQLGAYYYLTKPIDPPAMLAVIASALAEYTTRQLLQKEVRKTTSTLGMLEMCQFRFRTLDEVHDLAVFLAKVCPASENVVIGLTELMINAVEHGNLGLSYEDKSRLDMERQWTREIERRLTIPEFREKSATILFKRDAEKISFLIQDQGKGFDWETYMQIDPERAFDSHGRGIAMANLLSFDKLQYLGSGNKVLATLFTDSTS
ncbi:MAG: response regulator [Magnetococcales bacterium]|nr:response regulator [Magnetococcales bacterium]